MNRFALAKSASFAPCGSFPYCFLGIPASSVDCSTAQHSMLSHDRDGLLVKITDCRLCSAARWLHKRWNALRFVTMCLLVVAAFDNNCLEGQSTSEQTSNQSALDAYNVMGANSTAAVANEPVGTRYIIAIASLLLWVGTLQVLFPKAIFFDL